MKVHPWLHIALLLALLAGQFSAAGSALAGPAPQGNDPQPQAQALLDSLTPQERVGQLFLVTFVGSEAGPDSHVGQLIADYHIGGVVLLRETDNFVDAPDTLPAARSLIAGLQQIEADSAQEPRFDAASGEAYTPAFIPLMVAISQEGDGYPSDQLLSALSPQPSAMALGATWQPELAEQAGELLGRELAALGVNMLLGPSLDVLETPQPQNAGDMGVRSFGGDPYWVGQMGQAYTAGVHAGSQDRVALVAKHLPGYGSSDRPLEEEVPTIRKSLNQLTQIELPPFFAVTGDAPSPERTIDGMLMSHIRYQGFQGNIRATTRPVSFDPQAFSELMALPAFSEWRAAGGVVVSDQLGTRAVRRTYDATEREFPAVTVAREALQAGNDLLYLSNFVASGDPNSFTTIIHTAEFFTQKFREDQAFADRVDRAVLRILTLKYKMYGSFTLSQVIPDESLLEDVGNNTDLIFEVGRQGATLLSPDATSLPAVLPAAPAIDEQIVFFTDGYSVRQCGACAEQSGLSPNAMEQAIFRLYGPSAGNQVRPGNVTSYTFNRLVAALEAEFLGEGEEEDPVLRRLKQAQWVVFAMLDANAARANADALERLLSERPDLVQQKRVVVFAFNAPYYLDATDISKITAYYGLYSKKTEMTDVAARLLFQEIDAPGAPPVSVAGTGYELIEATAPHPDQEIPVVVRRVLPESSLTEATPEGAAEATETPNYRAGDLLALQAGPIIDHNHNPVPDNTPVSFVITITTEGSPVQRQISATTRGGKAQASYSIESEGSLEIQATSGEPAATSERLHFDVIGVNPEGIALQATQTAFAIMQSTPPGNQQAGVQGNLIIHNETNLTDWLTMLLVSGFISLLAYQTGANLGTVRWGVRWALASLLGGLMGGNYLALGLPGTEWLLLNMEEWGVATLVLLTGGLGWGAGLLWRSRGEKLTVESVTEGGDEAEQD